MSLKDKVCIITGGGSGIGSATALALSQKGAKTVLIGRTIEKLNSITSKINKGEISSIAFAFDVSDQQAVQKMVTETMAQFGRIDLLVNNAGHSSKNRLLKNTTPYDIQKVFDSNLKGTIYCTQQVLPAMLKANEGTIINISSLAGIIGSPLGGLAYSAAKAGVINFTNYINNELKNTGIRASVIIPGEVDTPILDHRPAVPSREARETMTTAEDIAKTILFVAELPKRTLISELIIRPTYQRDTTNEHRNN